METGAQDRLQLPVVSASAEYLVMGHLMRRNILAYKAPPGNEGYDLICVHPDPRYQQEAGQKSQIRIQVKSRYASDCGYVFSLHEKSFGAFDYVIAVFLNIGRFSGKNNGLDGASEPEFYTLPEQFARNHHDKESSWQKVRLKSLLSEIQHLKNQQGFELIAAELGIPKPQKRGSVD